MTRAIERQLDRIEKALQIAPDGEHDGLVWVTPEQSKVCRDLMHALLAGKYPPGHPLQAEAEERIGRTWPAAGCWIPAASAEQKRALAAAVIELRATAGTSPWQDASR